MATTIETSDMLKQQFILYISWIVRIMALILLRSGNIPSY